MWGGIVSRERASKTSSPRGSKTSVDVNLLENITPLIEHRVLTKAKQADNKTFPHSSSILITSLIADVCR